jgi:hypothetical protein
MHASRDSYKVFKFTALTLFLLMQLFLIFVKRHDTLDLDITPNTQPSPNIFSDGQVGQTFIARRNGLARIDIMLGTHGRTNDKDIVFKLQELTPEKKLSFTTSFNAANVKNNLYFPFRFRSIRHSRDKEYYFTLQSPESIPDNSICVWTNTKDIYRDGQYLFNDLTAEGDVIFRVYSKRPVFTELRRIVKNYPGIFGQVWLLFLAILFFEGIQILVFSKLLDFIRQTWRTP